MFNFGGNDVLGLTDMAELLGEAGVTMDDVARRYAEKRPGWDNYDRAVVTISGIAMMLGLEGNLGFALGVLETAYVEQEKRNVVDDVIATRQADLLARRDEIDAELSELENDEVIRDLNADSCPCPHGGGC